MKLLQLISIDSNLSKTIVKVITNDYRQRITESVREQIADIGLNAFPPWKNWRNDITPCSYPHYTTDHHTVTFLSLCTLLFSSHMPFQMFKTSNDVTE